MSSDDRATNAPPTQFGLFYPRGYVVIAFEASADAEAARQALLDGGYDPRDVSVVPGSEVLAHTTKHLGGASSLVKVMSHEYAFEQRHQEFAQRGFTFMLAYAPSELETESLMNVVGRFRYELAHKYDRFTLRDLRS